MPSVWGAVTLVEPAVAATLPVIPIVFAAARVLVIFPGACVQAEPSCHPARASVEARASTTVVVPASPTPVPGVACDASVPAVVSRKVNSVETRHLVTASLVLAVVADIITLNLNAEPLCLNQGDCH